MREGQRGREGVQEGGEEGKGEGGVRETKEGGKEGRGKGVEGG